MAGFEVVVRPVVFPNIRPARARTLPPEDDPTKGLATISGNPTEQASTSLSYSLNWSSSRQDEIEREVDEVRVYQKKDDGTINKNNFVDMEVAKRISKEGATGPSGQTDDAEIDAIRNADKGRQQRKRWREFYKKPEEADNIEIRKTGIIKKNEERPEE